MHTWRRALALGTVVLALVAGGCATATQTTQTLSVASGPVSFASTPSGNGYWAVYGNGLVRSFGDARPHGGTERVHLQSPIVGIASSVSGKGYWLVAADGGVFSFGDARFFGSLGRVHLLRPIVAITASPTGKGYWLLGADGGVFGFGDARYRGSAVAKHVTIAASDLAPTKDGGGYWIVGQDGRVLAFGNASSLGSASPRGHGPVSYIVRRADGRGYWLSSSDGRVFSFGAASKVSASLRAHVLVGLVRHRDGSWAVIGANGAAARFAEYVAVPKPPVTVPVTTPPPPPTTTTSAPPPPPTTTGTPTPPPLVLSSNIDDYIGLAGDQVVTVPDGTYTAGTVNAAHAATNGPLQGWLVLVAEHEHGVVVDLSNTPLTLDANTSRVLFVGFRFVNGPIFAYGSHLAFWYTDHTFPADVWSAQNGRYNSADTVHAYAPSSTDVAFYGADLHDTGDAIDVTNSTGTRLEGVKTWNLSDMGVDPQDHIHADAIDAVGGNTNGLTVTDSWIKGRIMIEDWNGKTGGPDVNMRFANTWVSNSPSSGFIFTASKPSGDRGLFGTRTNVRSWGHNNGLDRLDIIDGVHLTTPNTDASRVNVTDTNVDTTPPPPGAVSPADAWRAVHSYDDWQTFLFN